MIREKTPFLIEKAEVFDVMLINYMFPYSFKNMFCNPFR